MMGSFGVRLGISQKNAMIVAAMLTRAQAMMLCNWSLFWNTIVKNPVRNLTLGAQHFAQLMTLMEFGVMAALSPTLAESQESAAT